MSEEAEYPARVLEAHQELVAQIERTSGRMRVLSAITVLVAIILSLSYASQLLLPLTGTTMVTVELTDPSVIAVEVVVLLLAVAWVVIGTRDFVFASRMRREIAVARSKEKAIVDRVAS